MLRTRIKCLSKLCALKSVSSEALSITQLRLEAGKVEPRFSPRDASSARALRYCSAALHSCSVGYDSEGTARPACTLETLEQSGRNESWARGWLETASRPPGSRRSTTHRSTQRPSPSLCTDDYAAFLLSWQATVPGDTPLESRGDRLLQRSALATYLLILSSF